MILTNKKAQNITKPYTIILIIVVIAILSGGLFRFGQDMISNENGNLNNESIEYILTNSGFEPSTNISPDDSTDLFFSSDLNTSGNTKDYALEFEFYREQSSSIRTIVQDLFNVPTFFVRGLNLDLDAWSSVSILINILVWTILFYIIYRIVRGLL